LGTAEPGCESLDPVPGEDDTYRASLTIGVAAVSGRYEGTVAMRDKHPPEGYRLVVDGRGKGGFAKGEAEIELAENGDQTVVTVAGRAQVGGTVARVGQRLLGSVSKMMMDRFFACLHDQARGRDTT
jgi:carbon monoxide dehydrogenase subunit G